LKAFVYALGAVFSASAAHAQASSTQVTLYGIVDAAYAHNNNAPGGSRSELRSGGMAGNRFGIRGDEDLGGGLRAHFILENGFEIDTGATADPNRFWNRQVLVGLGGGWGNLTLGRQYTASFSILTTYMPKFFAAMYEPVHVITNGRADNAVVYDGTFNAVRVRAHYSFGESAQSSSAGSSKGLASTVRLGNANLAVYYDATNGALTSTGYSHQRLYGVAARYQMDTVGFKGGWRAAKTTSATGTPTQDDKVWWASASLRLAEPAELMVAYYQQDIERAGNTVRPVSPKQVSVWATYLLSKRTMLYAAAAHSKNAPLNFGFGGFSLAPGKTSQTGAGIGVRHSF
jgi:predicted porin